MQILFAPNALARKISTVSVGQQGSAATVEGKQKAKLDEANNAIGVMKQIKATKSDSQKDVARQKLAQLRARFESMKMMGGATPKQIAQLAKELAQAVKEYAAANGTSSETQSLPADAESGTNAAAVAPSEQSEVAKGPIEASSAPEAATQSVTLPPPPSDKLLAETDVDKNKAEDGHRSPSPYEKALISQAEASRPTKGSSEDDDRTFYAAARLLAEQIKALAQQAGKKTQHNQEFTDATKATDTVTDMADKAEVSVPRSVLSLSA